MKTTVRSMLLCALAATLAACATHGPPPADRAWMRAALEAVPAADDPAAAVAVGASPAAVVVHRTVEHGVPFGDPQEAKKKSPSGRDQRELSRYQGDERWERRSVEGEIAIMERHLHGKEQFYEEGYKRRPFGVNGFVQLMFPTTGEATDGLSREADWDELLEDGRGGGIELSYQVLPVFEPLIGVKYLVFSDARESIRQGAAVIEQKHEGLRAVPFYAGFRLNAPLEMPTEHWLSPEYGGLVHGVTPFIKVGVGGAYLDGTELTLTDQATLVANKFDFIDRGFVGYAELAVGVEYRAKGGYAFQVSVGIERFVGVDLAKPGKTAFPGVDLEDLDQAILPRLSASIHF